MRRILPNWILNAAFTTVMLLSATCWSQAYYNLQWPSSGSTMETGTLDVYAQAWEPGVTEAAGPGAGLEAWIGVSPQGQNTNPNTWTMWIPATFNTQAGNNDEFTAAIGSNLAPGTYYYASRFRLNNGSFVYGGYNSGAWNGTSNVSGQLTVTSNPACTGVWYADADGDGFGGDESVVACNQPEGYVPNTDDCNDADSNLFNNSDLYIDIDGDGYTGGPAADICYGNEVPEGYSATSLGSDCDDNDPTVWQTTSLYIDSDDDGYYGGVEDVCWGDTVPEGYELTTNGTDCNDNDPTVYYNSDAFVDNDGDGYTEGPAANICYGEQFPDGYSLQSLGADCDDNDPSKYRDDDMYIDADGDGYHGDNQDQVCYGANVPAGYSLTTLGEDCDDTNAAINPGASEIQGNQIDENCSGNDDDGVGQFYTQLKASQCNGTLERIFNALVAVVNTPNVTEYFFEVTNSSNNEKQTINGDEYYFQLTDLTSYEYETTYSVRVGMEVAGVWQGYGPACLVTSPSLTSGPSAIVIPQCGTTLSKRYSPIFVTGPNFISSYEIMVTNLNTLQTAMLTRTQPWFTLKMMPSIYDYSTNYSIQVRVATTGTYSEWSAPCTVSTPAAPNGGKYANAAVALKAVAYPNPFVDGFTLNMPNATVEAIQVKVYDMVGKLLEVRDIKASDLEAQTLGMNFPTGVYNVVVTQAGLAKSLRVIKR